MALVGNSALIYFVTIAIWHDHTQHEIVCRPFLLGLTITNLCICKNVVKLNLATNNFSKLNF